MVGGTDIQQSMVSFREEGANVLIGSPGRLEDRRDHADEVAVLEDAVRQEHGVGCGIGTRQFETSCGGIKSGEQFVLCHHLICGTTVAEGIEQA